MALSRWNRLYRRLWRLPGWGLFSWVVWLFRTGKIPPWAARYMDPFPGACGWTDKELETVAGVAARYRLSKSKLDGEVT